MADISGMITSEGNGLKVHGSVAQTMWQHDFNPNALRTFLDNNGQPRMPVQTLNENGEAVHGSVLTNNATLPHDAWKRMDNAVVGAARRRLIGVKDLRDRGLTYNLGGNGLATTVLEYQEMVSSQKAQISMSPATQGEGNTPEFDLKQFPLPIISADFPIDIRWLRSSQQAGRPIDTTQAEEAADSVSETTEDLLFNGKNAEALNGSAFSYGGGTVYGLLDHPNTITDVSLTGSWDDSAQDGRDILTDVQGALQALYDNKAFGPFAMYIPAHYQVKLTDDYITTGSQSNKSIQQRLMDTDALAYIKVSDMLPDDTVVLFQLDPKYVRMVTGMPITTVQWEESGGFVIRFKVMSIDLPQVRSDALNRGGVVKMTT